MHTSSPISARAQQRRNKKMQPGTIVSFTTLAHPPEEFGHYPRTIGLIQLEDGTMTLAPLLMTEPQIGMRVISRMRLSHVNAEKLRIYDVAYEEIAGVPAKEKQEFPGYILALTGPAGVGKSTVRNMLVKTIADYASKVPVVTTATRAQSERGEYRHVSKEKFEELAKSGDMIAMTQIGQDNAKEWYGYRHSDLAAIWKEGRVPVVTTEVHLLRGLADHYGRRSILSFGLLPPGKSKRVMLSHLLHRLRQRGKDTEELIDHALQKAANDLHLLKTHADLFDRILVNDDSEAVAKLLRKHLPEPMKG